MKKISIITGHYGCGKTNISANLAIKLSENNKVTVVDLDIVNPYFRTADFTDIFSGHNIELVKSIYANTNLDIPAISFDLERICSDDGYCIIDVGGDDDGATALGRYAEAFARFKDDIEFYYVINACRYFENEKDEALALLYDIENASHMKATAIINNTNLGKETTEQLIIDNLSYVEGIAKKANLPVRMVTAPSFLRSDRLDKIVNYTDIYVKPIWDTE